MSSHLIVLDANILVRAILGKKVREIILKFNDVVEFITPDICMEDAQKYLPIVFKKRGLPSDTALELLDNLCKLLQVVDQSIYQGHTIAAKKRICHRDIHDWPVVATALTFNCPIWTEDQDFFGSGLAIWTTDRIHLFFDSL